jgi:hypothetical protein
MAKKEGIMDEDEEGKGNDWKGLVSKRGVTGVESKGGTIANPIPHPPTLRKTLQYKRVQDDFEDS